MLNLQRFIILPKAGRSERLLSYASSHSIVIHGSVSPLAPPHYNLPAFFNPNGNKILNIHIGAEMHVDWIKWYDYTGDDNNGGGGNGGNDGCECKAKSTAR